MGIFYEEVMYKPQQETISLDIDILKEQREEFLN